MSSISIHVSDCECKFCSPDFETPDLAVKDLKKVVSSIRALFSIEENINRRWEHRVDETLLHDYHKPAFGKCAERTNRVRAEEAKTKIKAPVVPVTVMPKTVTQVVVQASPVQDAPSAKVEVPAAPMKKEENVQIVDISPLLPMSAPVAAPVQVISYPKVPKPESVPVPSATAVDRVHPYVSAGGALLRLVVGVYCLFVVCLMNGKVYDSLCGKEHADMRAENIKQCNISTLVWSRKCSEAPGWIRSTWNSCWSIDHDLICANLEGNKTAVCSHVDPGFFKVVAMCIAPVSTDPMANAWTSVTSFFLVVPQTVAIATWLTPSGTSQIYRAVTCVVSWVQLRVMSGRRSGTSGIQFVPMSTLLPLN